MTVHIADYSSWTRDDLLDETHKLATRLEELEGGKKTKGWAERQRIQRAMANAKYAAATLALIQLAEPFDAAALARREQRIADLRSDRDRHLSIALGTEFIQRHDAEATGQVRA